MRQKTIWCFIIGYITFETVWTTSFLIITADSLKKPLKYLFKSILRICYDSKPGGVCTFFPHLGEIVLKNLPRLFRRIPIFLPRLFRRIFFYLTEIFLLHPYGNILRENTYVLKKFESKKKRYSKKLSFLLHKYYLGVLGEIYFYLGDA